MNDKQRSGIDLVQQDSYLEILKRLGIPSASSDTFNADGIPFHLIYNSTLQKLRIFDKTNNIWKDATPVDLSNYYSKSEINALLNSISNSVNNNITDNIKGLTIAANPTTNELILLDKNLIEISRLSLAFLNNEGTKFILNNQTNTLDLINDDNIILSSIPISAFLLNVGSQLNFKSTEPFKLELLDNNNSVLSTVTITIDNIVGLRYALDSKEPTITVLPVIKGGTGLTSISVGNFIVGASVTGSEFMEITPQQVFDSLMNSNVLGDGLSYNNYILKVAYDSSMFSVDTLNKLKLKDQVIMPGTYSKVTVNQQGIVVGCSQISLFDLSTFLGNLEINNGNGIVVKDGNNAYLRSIVGTSGNINVNNGNGITDNPTIDLVPVMPKNVSYSNIDNFNINIDKYGRVINFTEVSGTSKIYRERTIFVDKNVNGITPQIERYDKPFNSIDVAILSLPLNQNHIKWDIVILSEGNHDLNSKLPANQNLNFISNNNTTINIKTTDTLVSDISATSTDFEIEFNLPKGRLLIDTTSQTSLMNTSNFTTLGLKINVDTCEFIGKSFNASTNQPYIYCGRLQLNANIFKCNGLISKIEHQTTFDTVNININKLETVAGYNTTICPVMLNTNIQRKINVNIDYISGNQIFTCTQNSYGLVFINIGTVNLTNTTFNGAWYCNNGGNFEIVINFNNSNITAAQINLVNQTVNNVIFTGNIKSNSVTITNNFNLGSTTNTVYFRKLKANLAMMEYYSGKIVFEDCNFTLPQPLIRLQAASSSGFIKFFGINYFTFTAPNQELITNAGQTVFGSIDIYGNIISNCTSYGPCSVANNNLLLVDSLSPKSHNTIYLSAYGNDILGQIENINKPYKTLRKVLEVRAKLSNDGNNDGMWKICILTAGTFTIDINMLSYQVSSPTNIKVNSLWIEYINQSAAGYPTISITDKEFNIPNVRLINVNLSISITNLSLNTFNLGVQGFGSFTQNNLLIRKLTINNTVSKTISTYGSYDNYYIDEYVADDYAYLSGFGGEDCLNIPYIRKMTVNSPLYNNGAGVESSKLASHSNSNVDYLIINEVSNSTNTNLQILGWCNNSNQTIKIRKTTNTGTGSIRFQFNSNNFVSSNQKLTLDLNNGDFQDLYIGSNSVNQPAIITGRCKIKYLNNVTGSLITINRNNKALNGFGESMLLDNFKPIVTYTTQPTFRLINFNGLNDSTNQKSLVIKDCYFETSHPIEIFSFSNISVNTESMLKFVGSNEFKNNKELFAFIGVNVSTLNNMFITNNNATLRHDFNKLCSGKIEIYNEANSINNSKKLFITQANNLNIILDNSFNNGLIYINDNTNHLNLPVTTIFIPNNLCNNFNLTVINNCGYYNALKFEALTVDVSVEHISSPTAIFRATTDNMPVYLTNSINNNNKVFKLIGNDFENDPAQGAQG